MYNSDGRIRQFINNAKKVIKFLVSDFTEHCASLYEHANYEGWRIDVDEGERVTFHRNDKVSSLQVGPGCLFEAYRNENFEDLIFKVFNAVPDFKENTDQLSSFRCSCDGSGKY